MTRPIAETWPTWIGIVRHGESEGNLARRAAMEQGHEQIALETRDMDVPLSPLGHRQSAAMGAWLGRHQSPPDAILSSPYARAHSTATAMARAARWSSPLILDERLREKEFGIIDTLTATGILARHPDQARFRKSLGKFYHRAPGGESWCDVILRLRSVADSLRLEYAGRRVLIVCHTVVVLCFRYLLEKLTEAEILAIDAAHNIANASLTSYSRDAIRENRWVPDLFNFVAPIEFAGETVTAESDAPVASR